MKSIRTKIGDKIKQTQVLLLESLRRTLKVPDEADLERKMKLVVEHMPSLTARYWPYRPEQQHWLIPKAEETLGIDPDDHLPIPPQSLWAGYSDNPKDYIEVGRRHFTQMFDALQSAGFVQTEGQRILELGCAAGRVLRNLRHAALSSEVWGTDISVPHIVWCRHHLSPPFRFFTNTTFPHLPVEDNYFDLVYAGSIFTHIGDLEDAWLLELRRIVRPGGYLYITVHDNHTIDAVMSVPPEHWIYTTNIRRQLDAFEQRTRFRESGFDMFLVSRDPGNTQVFHDLDYIRKNWGGVFDIVSVVPENMCVQTGIVLRKCTK